MGLNIEALLQTTVLKPLLTFLIPGCVILVPFLPIIWPLWVEASGAGTSFFSDLKTHPYLMGLVCFAAILTFGFIAHEVGATIEARVIDRELMERDENFLNEWHDYLRCAFPYPPIGQAYISNQVLYLKFELNLGAAMLISAVTSSLAMGYHEYSVPNCFLAGFILLLAAGYLWNEARDTARCLADARKALLKGVLMSGEGRSTASGTLSTNGTEPSPPVNLAKQIRSPSGADRTSSLAAKPDPA